MGEKDAAAASDAAMEGFEELPYMTAAQKRGVSRNTLSTLLNLEIPQICGQIVDQ